MKTYQPALCLAVVILAGCDGSDTTQTAVAPSFTPAVISSQACSDTANTTIAAAEISLASGGAKILSANLVKATDAGNANGEFCKVLGTVLPASPQAPVINFEVNLPANWNGKLLQVGGGGFDGTLVTGLDPMNFAPAGIATPLAQGYATLGDDAGHVGGVTDGTFAVNDEALANYGRLSLRKTHDVAISLLKRLYKVDKPRKSYFIGSSTGGRDALSVAQTWPEEYDAIFINRPALNYTGLRLSNLQLGRTLFLNGGAGWINPAKTTLLLNTVMAACDKLDGVEDGIISNLDACKAKSEAVIGTLRCGGGVDSGDSCLSDAQIATVKTMANPLKLNYALANGVTQYGGYNILAGMVFGPPYSSARNFGPNKVGPVAPDYLAVGSGSGANAPNAYVTGDQWMKYFITRNALFNSLTVDPLSPGIWQQRIVDVSVQSDATSTNLDAFLQKGGKIVWTHGSADEVVSTDSSIDYYKQLVAKYGQAKIDTAVRFYLIFGNGHGDTGPVLPTFDTLGILSDWVEKGTDPGNAIVVRNARVKAAVDKSPAGSAERPLCRYPMYPLYKGAGDPNLASSFSCT